MMEACIACERHDGLNLTDDGDCHGSCDGCDDLFDTHFNLQEHPSIQVQKRSREKNQNEGPRTFLSPNLL